MNVKQHLLGLYWLICLQEDVPQALPYRLVHAWGLHVGKTSFDGNSLLKLGNGIL